MEITARPNNQITGWKPRKLAVEAYAFMSVSRLKMGLQIDTE